MLASLGPVVIAAVVALLLTNLLNGDSAPLYHVEFHETLSATHYALMLATALLAGLCGPLFIWLMSYSHRCFVRLRLSVAAGAGRHRRSAVAARAGRLGKWLQRCAKLSSFAAALQRHDCGVCLQTARRAGQQRFRRAGRRFYPNAVCWAGMGMLFASLTGLWLPDYQAIAIVVGLTGMAAFLAATTHAPIMSR
jgi:CIC family chloride channel protein